MNQLNRSTVLPTSCVLQPYIYNARAATTAGWLLVFSWTDSVTAAVCSLANSFFPFGYHRGPSELPNLELIDGEPAGLAWALR